MLGQHTIRASALHAIIGFAETQGVGGLRERLGLDDGASEDLDRRLPLALTDAAWVLAARLGPDDISLRAAKAADGKAFGLVSYLLAASNTVGEALARLVRFYPVLSTGTRHRVSSRSNEVRVLVDLAGAQLRDPVVESFAVGIVAVFTRNESGDAFRPRRVWLRQQAPAASLCAAHEKAFGATVEFGAPRSGFSLARDDLALPLRGADPELARILEAHAIRLLAESNPKPSLPDRVGACIVDGNTRADSIATALGLSERSLRRGLAAQGTSLGELQSRHRGRAALRLLGDPQLRLPDVAQQLGYAEAASFSRAFRRWYGLSPRAYVRANATATGS